MSMLEIPTKNGHTWIPLDNHLALEQRMLFISYEIDEYIAKDIMTALHYLDSKNNDPIIININSPGGYVSSGLAIYDTIRSIHSPVHTVCSGEACSMAAVLLACGDERYATPNCRIMIHQAAGGVSGKTSEIKVQAQEQIRVEAMLVQILAKHTGHNIKKVKQDMQNDFYMSAEEALKYNIIDNIIKETK